MGAIQSRAIQEREREMETIAAESLRTRYEGYYI